MRLVRRIFTEKRKKGRTPFGKDESGATAVEFAFVALPFFLVVMGIIEIGLAHLVNRMVDNAVVEASRLIRTGQATNLSFDEDDFETEICNALPAFLCDTDRILVSVDQINSFSDAGSISDSLFDTDGELNEESSFDPSAQGEIVVVHAIYRWPMFTSLLALNAADNGTERYLSSTMVFRNEPWG